MTDFTFEGKQRTLFLGMMAVGLVCLVATFFAEDAGHHARFWSNFLHNSVFFTGVAFTSLFVYCAFTTAYAGWYTVMKRVWEAYAQFLIVGLVFMLIIAAGVFLHWHHLYHWADESLLDPSNPDKYDAVLAGKSSFLNKYWYGIGTLLIVGTWYVFATRIRSISLDEDRSGTTEYTHHSRLRRWCAAFLPIAGFSSAAIIWQWVMSIDSHWYSTMFAWYTTASWFVSALCLTILTLIYLKSKGYYNNLTDEHLHDLGKYLFAFSIFWTYLWFSQYMLIWYANNGEETIYFHTRINEYPVLFYGNLLINFVLPFLVLMRNSTKRKYGTLIFVSVMVLFGHWWDFFQMIKPGVNPHAGAHGDHGGHADHGHGHDHAHDVAHAVADHAEHASNFASGFTIPGLLEVGTFIGFLGLFLYVAFAQLAKAKLEPENDPYYAESLHHHV